MLGEVWQADHDPSGSGASCYLPAAVPSGCTSEPRQGGITEMRFRFNGTVTGCLLSVEQAECGPDQYVAYEGDMPSCVSPGNELVCTFDPALANAWTYRFNLTGGSAVIRGLREDVNNSGSVNATDRSVVVGVWTGPDSYSCLTDLNNDGTTNATDRSIVIGAWTGPQNCAPKAVATSTLGGWRGGNPPTRPAVKTPLRTPHGPDASGGGAVRQASPILDAPRPPLAAKTDEPGGSDSDAEWTTVSGTADLTVWPMGGGGPVSVLEVGQRYEVRYSGASHPVDAYALFASSLECDTPPITAPDPADATGLFAFSAVEGDAANQNAEGLVRCVMALDDQSGTGWLGGPAGPLCSFTAAQPGEMLLEVWLSWADEAGQTTYESQGQVSLGITD